MRRQKCSKSPSCFRLVSEFRWYSKIAGGSFDFRDTLESENSSGRLARMTSEGRNPLEFGPVACAALAILVLLFVKVPSLLF